MDFDLVSAVESCRTAEREQAVFYRALAARAEDGGDVMLSERFNGLHADEQHHLSRLTARLLELGHVPQGLEPTPRGDVSLDTWEADARRREREEVSRYERLLREPLDPATESLIRQILEVERHHEEELGGKWMPA